jgi:hypothetical protein
MAIKGINVQNYEVYQPRKGKFYFNVTEDEWKQLKLDFHNSELSQCKHAQEKLKDLLY